MQLWLVASVCNLALLWDTLARQSKGLRCLDDTIPFELDHMLGKCHHPERLSMFAIGRVKSYDHLGVEICWPALEIHADHARVALSDDLSSTLASLSVAITLELTKRSLTFTHGLPRRQTLLLQPGHADEFIDQLRSDLGIFERIQSMEFPGKDIMVARSCFQLTSVKQLVGLLKIEGWKLTARPGSSNCFGPQQFGFTES